MDLDEVLDLVEQELLGGDTPLSIDRSGVLDEDGKMAGRAAEEDHTRKKAVTYGCGVRVRVRIRITVGG